MRGSIILRSMPTRKTQREAAQNKSSFLQEPGTRGKIAEYTLQSPTWEPVTYAYNRIVFPPTAALPTATRAFTRKLFGNARGAVTAGAVHSFSFQLLKRARRFRVSRESIATGVEQTSSLKEQKISARAVPFPDPNFPRRQSSAIYNLGRL